MKRFGKVVLVAALIVLQAAKLVFSQIRLDPGDTGEYSFTVENPPTNDESFNHPLIVYENKPWWLHLLGTLTYPPIPPGESCDMVLEFSIDEKAPPGTYPLDFKVTYSNGNMSPPFWKPAKKVTVIISGNPTREDAAMRSERAPAARSKRSARAEAAEPAGTVANTRLGTGRAKRPKAAPPRFRFPVDAEVVIYARPGDKETKAVQLSLEYRGMGWAKGSRSLFGSLFGGNPE